MSEKNNNQTAESVLTLNVHSVSKLIAPTNLRLSSRIYGKLKVSFISGDNLNMKFKYFSFI